MLGSLGCGSSDDANSDIQPPSNTYDNTSPEDEPSQDEIDQLIIEEAIITDFVLLNVSESEAQQHIGESDLIEGEAIAVDNSSSVLPEFFVTKKKAIRGEHMGDLLVPMDIACYKYQETSLKCYNMHNQI